MALSKVAIDYQCVQCREFAMLHQLVRVAVSEVSSPNPSAAYQLSSDCIYGKQIRRSPSCDRHHESEELHDLLKLPVLNSKHIAHHRAQK
jgi:hypothetical protein